MTHEERAQDLDWLCWRAYSTSEEQEGEQEHGAECKGDLHRGHSTGDGVAKAEGDVGDEHNDAAEGQKDIKLIANACTKVSTRWCPQASQDHGQGKCVCVMQHNVPTIQ